MGDGEVGLCGPTASAAAPKGQASPCARRGIKVYSGCPLGRRTSREEALGFVNGSGRYGDEGAG